MTEQRPLSSLKLRTFSITLDTKDFDRLTGWSIRNTVPRSQMARDILHRWLDDRQSGLLLYYKHLAETQCKTIYQVETEILGQAKREARKAKSREENSDTTRLSLSIPSWDNRRLLGHAYSEGVTKSEMTRRIVTPWLKERDVELEIFWTEVAKWLECNVEEAKQRMIEDFEQQGR